MTPAGQKSPFFGGDGASLMAGGSGGGGGVDGNAIVKLHAGNLEAFLKGPRLLKVGFRGLEFGFRV